MEVILSLMMISSCSIIAFAQENKFKDVNKYSEWLMGYHQHPEPEKLLSAFEYGVTNEEITEAGTLPLVLAFFGAIFRTDDKVMTHFFDIVKISSSTELHYGFVGALWMTNTPLSRATLEKYLQLDSKKYESDGTENERPFDIYKDPIGDPSDLDMIWADFFATGNPSDIQRIISVLLEKTPSSNAAKWSLTSNGTRYKRVYEVLQSEWTLHKNEAVGKELSIILDEIEKSLLKKKH